MIGDQFNYERNKNIFNGNGNVEINDYEKDFTINANEITYYKNEELVFTNGKTLAQFLSKYNFKSSDVYLYKDIMELKSSKKSNLLDNDNNFYEADEWELYNLTDDIGEDRNIIKKHPKDASNLSNKIQTWLGQKHPTRKPKYPLSKKSGKSVPPRLL